MEAEAAVAVEVEAAEVEEEEALAFATRRPHRHPARAPTRELQGYPRATGFPGADVSPFPGVPARVVLRLLILT